MYLPTWEQSINVGEYGLQAAHCQRPKRTLLLASAASVGAGRQRLSSLARLYACSA